jgi:hypothetical protein
MKPLIGMVGAGLVEGVGHIPSPTATVDIIKLAIQLVLGIASLWQMFKKPKEVISNQNQQ